MSDSWALFKTAEKKVTIDEVCPLLLNVHHYGKENLTQQHFWVLIFCYCIPNAMISVWKYRKYKSWNVKCIDMHTVNQQNFVCDLICDFGKFAKLKCANYIVELAL